MKEYAIEINCKIVKTTDSFAKAEKLFNEYCEKYNAETNEINLIARGCGVMISNQLGEDFCY